MNLKLHHYPFLIFITSIIYKIANFYVYRNDIYFDLSLELQIGKKILETWDHFFIFGKVCYTTITYYLVFSHLGLYGIKFLNLSLYLLTAMIMLEIFKPFFERIELLWALIFYSFYPGTNLNVIAGEVADTLYPLLLSFGILLYCKKQKIYTTAIFIGMALLIKYASFLFILGFGGFLILAKKWKDFSILMIISITPWICLCFIDRQIADDFLATLKSNYHYNHWSDVVFKLFSTGMVPFFALASMEARKHIGSDFRGLTQRSDYLILGFVIPFVYFLYVLLFRVGHSASYVMSCCMIFLSPLLGANLEDFLSKKSWSHKARWAIALFYIIVCIGITQKNLHTDLMSIFSVDFSH